MHEYCHPGAMQGLRRPAQWRSYGAAVLLTMFVVAGCSKAPAPPVVPPAASAPEGRSPASANQTEVAKAELGRLFANLTPAASQVLFARYRAISTALPTVTGTAHGPLGHGSQWIDWAKDQPAADSIDTDDMVSILQESVSLPGIGQINEVFDDSVDDILSEAQCTANGKPQIAYGPHAIAGLSPLALRFMKFHEVGHFASHHLNCATHDTLPGYKERDADCYSVGHLETLGIGGEDAIGGASDYLHSRNDPADDHYETSQARSIYVRRHCRG